MFNMLFKSEYARKWHRLNAELVTAHAQLCNEAQDAQNEWQDAGRPKDGGAFERARLTDMKCRDMSEFLYGP